MIVNHKKLNKSGVKSCGHSSKNFFDSWPAQQGLTDGAVLHEKSQQLSRLTVVDFCAWQMANVTDYQRTVVRLCTQNLYI